MAASPKRHPARIRATAGADADGRLTGFRFHGDFDTGAYASWGPTVANRVPVHAMGPYRWDAALATTRAVYTDNPPAGAFRGFGVPQAAIAHEALMDDLARAARPRPAASSGSPMPSAPARRTPTGQALVGERGAPGLPRGASARTGLGCGAEAAAHNAASRSSGSVTRRGVGIGAMWYGIGNTVARQPVDDRDGRHARRAGSCCSAARSTSARAPRPCSSRSPRTPSALPPRRRRARQRRHGPHRRRRQVLGLAPDVRLGQRGAARGRGAPAPDPAARRGRRGRDRDRARARRGRWRAIVEPDDAGRDLDRARRAARRSP